MICKTIMFDHKSRSQYCTSSDHENFLQFTLYSQTYQSSLVFDFCVENSPETMEKLGLVGATGVVLLCSVCLGRALLFLSPPVVRR
jgi:hypothetical protein